MKMDTYGLSDTYNYFRPGPDIALAASIETAMRKGEPWVGYYWEPTWIMGKYDLTLLEEAACSDELWEDGYRCAFQSGDVTICVNKDLPEKAPDVVSNGKYRPVQV